MIKINKKRIKIRNEEVAYLETGNGKENLVLVHGNMSSSIHYSPLIERLSGDFKIIAPELRGFGDSSYNRRFDSLHELADDLIEFLELLKIKNAYLVGWSTGGGIIMVIAAKRPDLVKKMVLLESVSPKGYPIFKKDAKGQPLIGQVYATKAEMEKDPVQVAPSQTIITNKDYNTMTYIWNAVIYTAGNKPSDADNRTYMDELFKQRSLFDIDWALAKFNITSQAGLYGMGDGLIKKIKAPTLVIWGEKDITVLKYMFDETVQALGALGQAKTYQNSAHSPLIDKPDELAKDIKEFCK
jgi:pimeloyl-ACP methyl ester carboxylesterase